jgi:hypothetical protein
MRINLPILMLWSVTAGSLLGNGVALGIIPLIIVGATMSIICPGGIIAAWIYSRLKR